MRRRRRPVVEVKPLGALTREEAPVSTGRKLLRMAASLLPPKVSTPVPAMLPVLVKASTPVPLASMPPAPLRVKSRSVLAPAPV